MQQRPSKAVRKIDAGSFKDHLEACQVTVSLSLWMASERLHESPLPPRIASGPIQVLERHLDEIDVATGGRAEQEVLGDRASRRHEAFWQTAGGFVLEQPPRSLRQPEVAGRPGVHESTVTFQQLHHGSVLPGVRFVHRRARGVDVRVRVCSMLQQDLRHGGLARDRALTERLAPGVDDLLESIHAFALIGVESEVEQQGQHLWPARRHRVSDEPPLAGQRAFPVTRPQPAGVACRDCPTGRSLRATPEQHLRELRDQTRPVGRARIAFAPDKIQRGLACRGAHIHVRAAIDQPGAQPSPQVRGGPMERGHPSLRILYLDESWMRVKRPDHRLFVAALKCVHQIGRHRRIRGSGRGRASHGALRLE